MKKQLGVFALCSALLMSGSAAFGQSHESHPPPPHRRGQVEHPVNVSHHRGMYEQGHRQGWYKEGGRVPSAYRGGHYVVTNWRANHLRQPPRGYHWVHSDNGDFLLVAISTGIIASIIANAINR